MSDEVQRGKRDPQEPPSRSRRRFFTMVGAGGLAVAAATFGRSTPAYAANYGCCNLHFSPPNESWSQCVNGSGVYVWGCYLGGGVDCSCCENAFQSGNNVFYTGSAAYCH